MGLQIGALAVRRSILILASPERVWQEFATADRIAAWLDRGHTVHSIEPRLGGEAEMSVEIDGERRFYGGPIIAFEPCREMSLKITWKRPWDTTFATTTPTFWTFRLTPIYDGTLVEIFHHGFELNGALSADILEGYEEGWDIRHLKALRGVVEAA